MSTVIIIILVSSGCNGYCYICFFIDNLLLLTRKSLVIYCYVRSVAVVVLVPIAAIAMIIRAIIIIRRLLL